MATHSSILAWRISWTEEPGVLQSMGLYFYHRSHSAQGQGHTRERSLGEGDLTGILPTEAPVESPPQRTQVQSRILP